MRTRHDPLKWPFAIGLALLLVIGSVWLVPASWVDGFFSPLNLNSPDEKAEARSWLIILPPPEVVVETRVIEPEKSPEKKPLHREPEDPGWWTEGWRIRAVQQTDSWQQPTRQDSLKVVCEALGLGQDFYTYALPDSVLAHRLLLLRIEDSFAFDELKPYLSALGKGKHMLDKASREADMYDEHLNSQIMVPD